MEYSAIIEKTTGKVLEIHNNERSSVEGLQYYAGFAWRTGCSVKEFIDYSNGCSIKADVYIIEYKPKVRFIIEHSPKHNFDN
jgi:hypothetical protein